MRCCGGFLGMLSGLFGGRALVPAGIHGAVAAAKCWAHFGKRLVDGHTDTKRSESALISLERQRCKKGVRGVTSSLRSIPAPPGRLAGAGAGSHPPAATVLLTAL